MADIPQYQTAVIYKNKLVNSTSLPAAAVGEGAVCATCREPGVLKMSEDGPVLSHEKSSINHQPEDLIIRMAKKIILKRLKEMFQNETVDGDVFYEKGILDFAVVFSNGAKIAVEYLASAPLNLNSHYEYWEDQGVRLLVILDWRRLGLKKDDQIASVNLSQSETSLILNREPLIYLDAEKRNFIEVIPPGPALELVRLGRVEKLGRLKCLIRRYSLSQLRLVQGKMIFLDSFYEPPNESPKLPKRLEKRYQAIKKVRPRDSDR